MKYVLLAAAILTVSGLLSSCSDSNPSGTGGIVPADSTKLGNLKKLIRDLWWTSVSYDTTTNVTYSPHTVTTIQDTAYHRAYNRVTDLVLIRDQIHFVIESWDTTIDPVSGTVGAVTHDTAFILHTGSSLEYVTVPGSSIWDTLTYSVLALPMPSSGSWTLMDESIDSTYRFSISIVPVKARVIYSFTGTGQMSGTVSYSCMMSQVQCNVALGITVSSGVMIADSIIKLLTDTIAVVGDTLMTSNGTTSMSMYFSPDYAMALFTRSVDIKADSSYVDTSKAMVRDTVKKTSYIQQYCDPRLGADSVIQLR